MRQRDINKNPIKNEKGFSLIELIIVCLVISILATASIPSIQRSLQLYRLESAAGLLANRLTEAKLTAIKRNRAASLQINSTRKTLEVWTTNESGQSIRTGQTIPIPSDISIVSGSPSSVSFGSLGRNQANTNSVIRFNLPNTSYCRSVTVSAIGNITTAPC
jgi:prepilin-type N-terminal cleavage/methylation domain-containing protein